MKSNRKREKTWMKNHPMEGDDIITSFYDLLCKRNPKTMKPCRNVFVPDTVVFEHNFPRGWYTTDVKAKEVMRRQGKDLDAATIEQGFSRVVVDNLPIVATYLSIHEEALANGVTETTTRVQVLNQEDITAFVARKNKNNGILQRFVFPKGYHNNVIKVVWSPRIAIIQRRKNKYPIMDRKRAENDPFIITVTYEGPGYLSEESGVSAHIAFEVKNVCAEIIRHFFHTEHKYITRMVLYFKSDVRDRLWLLWCGSLRVAERNTQSHMPMNLAPRFGEPLHEGAIGEQEMLRRVDRAYYVIMRDGPLCDTYIRGGDKQSDVNSEKRYLHRAKARNGSPTNSGEPNSLESKRAIGGHDLSDELRGLLEGMQNLEEMVQEAFRDIFYRAYSHFLSRSNRPFDVVVPPSVVNVLTSASTCELMSLLSFDRKPEEELALKHEKEVVVAGGSITNAGNACAEVAAADDPSGSAEEVKDGEEPSPAVAEPEPAQEPMLFVIPAKPHLPLSLLTEKTAKWIEDLFSCRREDVRRDYEGRAEEAEAEGEGKERSTTGDPVEREVVCHIDRGDEPFASLDEM